MNNQINTQYAKCLASRDDVEIIDMLHGMVNDLKPHFDNADNFQKQLDWIKVHVEHLMVGRKNLQ